MRGNVNESKSFRFFRLFIYVMMPLLLFSSSMEIYVGHYTSGLLHVLTGITILLVMRSTKKMLTWDLLPKQTNTVVAICMVAFLASPFPGWEQYAAWRHYVAMMVILTISILWFRYLNVLKANHP